MRYFSYNDFMDCSQKREIKEIKRIEEKIERYEIKNGNKTTIKHKNKIIEILKNQKELRNFLKLFFNLHEIEKIVYCNNIKIKDTKDDYLICKIENKEIFIFIKILKKIDNNISYKMLENSLKIIKKWDLEEKEKNKRYPIVIPIVIYIGKEKWNINKENSNSKLNYITFKENRINFSYNVIKINELNFKELKSEKSEFINEIIKFNNKY